jgi:hypothetical protein
MSDDPLSRILSAIERLHVDLLDRLNRVEGPLAGHGQPAAPPEGSPDFMPAGVVAHIQNVGDVEGHLGDWIGERGSGRWIEGLRIIPPQDISQDDFRYQIVLGRNQLSPWVPAGKYCGSEGLAMPLRGFCLALSGNIAANYECQYSGTFVDGSQSGLIAVGQVCAAATLAPLEAFQITLRPRTALR